MRKVHQKQGKWKHNNKDYIKYLNAKKKVKQIKGFYIHALVFVLVNILIILCNYSKNMVTLNSKISGEHLFGELDLACTRFIGFFA